jgi:hypothetical protein
MEDWMSSKTGLDAFEEGQISCYCSPVFQPGTQFRSVDTKKKYFVFGI